MRRASSIFLSLAPGHYSISASATGFKKKNLADITVSAEQIQSVNVTMEVGDVSQSITVNGDVTPPIDTETGQISGTLDAKAIQNLPSLGRDPFQLLRLAPGVFGDAAHSNNGGSQNTPGSAGPGGTSVSASIFQTENQVQINANGQRNTTNDYQIDGVEVNSLAWGGAAVITPNEESVKEVRVTSNSYSAESGRNSGAQVEVVSQNGTNEYHGSLVLQNGSAGSQRLPALQRPRWTVSGPARLKSLQSVRRQRRRPDHQEPSIRFLLVRNAAQQRTKYQQHMVGDSAVPRRGTCGQHRQRVADVPR